MKISNLAAIALVNTMTARFNVGGAGSVRFYDGAQPANVDVAITSQNLLGQITYAATSHAAAVDTTDSATAAVNAVTTGLAVAAGTATWCRAYDGAGLASCDGDVGLTSSGADFEATDVTFEINDVIDLVAHNISINE